MVGDDHDQLEQEEERRQRHDAGYREIHGEQRVAGVHPEYAVEIPEIEDVQHPEDLEHDEGGPCKHAADMPLAVVAHGEGDDDQGDPSDHASVQHVLDAVEDEIRRQHWEDVRHQHQRE